MKYYLVSLLILILCTFNIHSSVTHIWPQSGTNDGVKPVKIYGGGFNSGVSSVELQKSGYPSIYASNINVQADNYLTCDFDLDEVFMTTYNLVINSDTLKMCFTVNHRYSETIWKIIDIHEYQDYWFGVPNAQIGDADNDGQLELYFLALTHIYQCKWNGSTWEINDIGYGNDLMISLAVGDADNDGQQEIYAGCEDNCIYQLKWDGNYWNKLIICLCDWSPKSLTIGDGNNNGEHEIYFKSYSFSEQLYQLKWDGGGWNVDSMGGVYHGHKNDGVVVGDGNYDGELEVYACGGRIDQNKWNGSEWVRTTIVGGTDHWRISFGDGDNSGSNEIYSGDYILSQFQWDGGSWNQTVIANSDFITIADGNNDGGMEIYSSLNDSLFQHKWISEQWNSTNLELRDCYEIAGICSGDADNNGFIDIYVFFKDVTSDRRLYQYQIQPAYLTDTIHDFGKMCIGDSAIWDIYIENVSYQDLIVDSIIFPISGYSLLNYSTPDTLYSGDSVLASILFKPLNIGFYSCSAQVYINDPYFPVIYLKLTGRGEYSCAVTDIYPHSATNNGTSSVKIFGDGFYLGVSSIELQKEGYPSIYANNISIQSDNYLTCDFDLTGELPVTYNLLVNSDTLDMCFTVNQLLESTDYCWQRAVIGSYTSSAQGITIGDGDIDGEMEIYCARTSLIDGSFIDQLDWNGIAWVYTEVYFCLSQHARKAVVGDGNNDGKLGIYSAFSHGQVFQFQWNGITWDTVNFGILSNSTITGVDLGDLDYDGVTDVYGVHWDQQIYKFNWNGFSWDVDYLGNLGVDHLTCIAIGDGNNDGILEAYVSDRDGYIYQVRWINPNWEITEMGYGGDNWVEVGDGDNDGLNEIYGASSNGMLYQFRWTGSIWIISELNSPIADMSSVDIGDGNNDGMNEVYGACSNGHIYELTWNGISWIISDIGSGSSPMRSVEVGDGNNDGFIEVYGSNVDCNIYQFQSIRQYLSDTLLDFGILAPGDSSTLNFKINNVSYQELIVDSLILPLSEYSIINYVNPDTIQPGDSSVVEIMYKPDSFGYYQCSLQVFLSDSFFPSYYVYLNGICDTTHPEKVVLISPDSAGYSNSTVNFFWHPSYDSFPGVDYYQLQWALDSNLSVSLHQYDVFDTTKYIYYTFPADVYYWRVKAYDHIGFESSWSNIWSFTVDPTSVEEEISSVPDKFSYRLSYEDRGEVSFMFSIPAGSELILKVYDLSGRLVETPISGTLSPGIHQIPFRSERSGIYFYRLESDYLTETGKFMVVR
ncbi:MAG: hypothetical protein APR63_08715 [Desulfuromonas sp. SDB]|nr:MAG: hypothetical protein APR63_08715 [Desulfuromonas sp. SDB]